MFVLELYCSLETAEAPYREVTRSMIVHSLATTTMEDKKTRMKMQAMGIATFATSRTWADKPDVKRKEKWSAMRILIHTSTAMELCTELEPGLALMIILAAMKLLRMSLLNPNDRSIL